MKSRLISYLFSFFSILIICTGCDTAGISMPYDSAEYENGNWTVDSVVSHFEELGFSDIEVINVLESFGKEKIGIYNITIEDPSSNSLFTVYRSFNKGEELDAWLDIRIETYTVIPTLTTDNCSDFAELTQTGDLSAQQVASFMYSHNGEHLEFDGTITDWYDEAFWEGVSFTIAVENSNQMSLSWSTIDYKNLGLAGDYDFANYSTGLISEGMPVHIIAKIVSSENKWSLDIESMQIE